MTIACFSYWPPVIIFVLGLGRDHYLIIIYCILILTPEIGSSERDLEGKSLDSSEIEIG